MTEVVTQQITHQEESIVVSQPVAEINGASAETNGSAVNGGNIETAVVNGSNKTVKKAKEPEPPKDPKQDPIGWLQQQSKSAKHKVNYELLNWAQKYAVEEMAKRPELPGKADKVTSSQFLGHLRDGILLAQLANKLEPGSIENIHEGDEVKTNKDQQISNLQGFINFAKEKVGLAEDQVFTVADLQEKGKAGYDAVFNTLFQTASKAQEKFNQAEFEFDRVTQEASGMVEPNLVQKVLAYVPLHLFKRNSTSGNEKTNTAQNETGNHKNGTTEKVSDSHQQPLIQDETTKYSEVVTTNA